MVMTHPASGRRAGQKTAREPGFDQSTPITKTNAPGSPARGVRHKARRPQENRPPVLFSHGLIRPAGPGDSGAREQFRPHWSRALVVVHLIVVTTLCLPAIGEVLLSVS